MRGNGIEKTKEDIEEKDERRKWSSEDQGNLVELIIQRRLKCTF